MEIRTLIKQLLKEYYDDLDDFSGFDDFRTSGPKNTNTFIKNLPDTIRLYRILVADSVDTINKNEIGSHYSMDKKNLLKTHSFLKGKKYFLVTVDSPKKLVDTKITLQNNELYPNEKEVTLKNKGRGVKIIAIEELN